MKIGINALFYQTPATGTAQYMSHLLDALAQLDTQNEYVLLGPRPLPLSDSPPFPYQVHAVPNFAARNESIAKVTWEQYTAPGAAQREQVDLFHVPYFAPPLLSAIPTIATIHDVIPLRLPAYHPTGKIKAYFNLVSRAARGAARIITVSQHAKRDIVETLKINPNNIYVTYIAAGDEYKPEPDPEKLAEVRARYGLSERYIFYLGGLDQRKNVPQLVRAFAQLRARLAETDQSDVQLFISGNPDKTRGALFPDPRPVATELGVDKHITYRFVEEEDKPLVYAGASLFVFPSLYEGFGLTPLEALACGTPVVCSNRTSLPEVVGDAALTVDPENLTDLAEAMRRVLTDPELAADLRARGIERAKQFSWSKTAETTLKIYEDVYAISRR